MNTRFCCALLLALLATQTLEAQADAPNFGGSSLTAPRRDWPTNGGDWYNRRYSPLTQIDRANVASLKGVLELGIRIFLTGGMSLPGRIKPSSGTSESL